jgi:hypothetical protein
MTEARPFLWFVKCGITLRNEVLWQRLGHYELPLPKDTADVRKLAFTWYVTLKQHQSTSIGHDDKFVEKVLRSTDMDQYSLNKMITPDELDVNHLIFALIQGVQSALLVLERQEDSNKIILGRLRIPEEGEYKDTKGMFKIYGRWYVCNRLYVAKQNTDCSIECEGRIIHYKWLGVV